MKITPADVGRKVVLSGKAVRKNFVGDIRFCNKCECSYIITEAMCRNRSYVCPKCASKYSCEYVRKNKEKSRQHRKEYSKKICQKKIYEKTRLYRLNNPEKVKAHNIVSSVIRMGKLVRLPCEVCGHEKTHAHHDNYNLPLEVKWLCPVHHAEEHLLKAREAK
jgi:6-phosphofructokinase